MSPPFMGVCKLTLDTHVWSTSSKPSQTQTLSSKDSTLLKPAYKRTEEELPGLPGGPEGSPA